MQSPLTTSLAAATSDIAEQDDDGEGADSIAETRLQGIETSAKPVDCQGEHWNDQV